MALTDLSKLILISPGKNPTFIPSKISTPIDIEPNSPNIRLGVLPKTTNAAFHGNLILYDYF